MKRESNQEAVHKYKAIKSHSKHKKIITDPFIVNSFPGTRNKKQEYKLIAILMITMLDKAQMVFASDLEVLP